MVSWTASSNGGDPDLRLHRDLRPERDHYGRRRIAPLGDGDGLTNGVTYTFNVVARNDVGSAAAPAPSNPVTPATVPGTPTGVVATGGKHQATVSWIDPSNGRSPTTSYTVVSTCGGFTSVDGGSRTSATVTGLKNGTTYTFMVSAANAVVTGPASAPSNAVSHHRTPEQPVGADRQGLPTYGRSALSRPPPHCDAGSQQGGFVVDRGDVEGVESLGTLGFNGRIHENEGGGQWQARRTRT
jgi:hypothetical protein